MEATIDELVDNLIKEKHLDGKEADEITEALELASKYIETSRLSGFVKSVREKIDAPASEIFTQNGLNINELKNAAEVIANVVIKEQVKDSEKNQNNNVSEYTQDAVDNTNKDDKNLVVEFEDKVKEYKSDLDDFYKGFLGMNPEDIPEDEKEEEAKELAEIEVYSNLVDKYCEAGYSLEESKDIACKELNYSRTDAEEYKRETSLIKLTIVKAQKKVKESEGQISFEEAVKEEFSNSPSRDAATPNEVKEQIEKGEENTPFYRKVFSDRFKKAAELVQEDIDRIDQFISEKGDIVYETYSLYNYKLERERKIREVRTARKNQDRFDGTLEKKTESKKQKYEQILKKAKDKYFSSNMTITELYESLKKEGDIPKELDVYDIYDSIVDESRKYLTPENCNTIKEFEIQMRDETVKVEALRKMIENAQKSTTITPQRQKELEDEYSKEIQKCENKMNGKKETIMYLKNAVYAQRTVKDNSEVEAQIDQQNQIETTSTETRNANAVVSLNTEEPKKKHSFLSFVKKFGKKLKITPKEVNEEVSELSDLQKAELEEAKTQAKAIKDNKTNSSIEVSTINVGDKESVIETEAPNVSDDDQR